MIPAVSRARGRAAADIAQSFRRFHREEPTRVLSLDFDDKGESLITSETDESIQLYNVLDGTFKKSLYSKKYGVKLAKFTHNATSIIYASTKENGALCILLPCCRC